MVFWHPSLCSKTYTCGLIKSAQHRFTFIWLVKHLTVRNGDGGGRSLDGAGYIRQPYICIHTATTYTKSAPFFFLFPRRFGEQENGLLDGDRLWSCHNDSG